MRVRKRSTTTKQVSLKVFTVSAYLDNNATTALHEQVLESMLPFMGAVCGNPSSLHRFGRMQRDAIEQAREQVAQLVGARAEQVVFTSGGTESNNLLLRGFRQQVESARPDGTRGRRVAVSAVEHMSLLEPARHLYVGELDSIHVDSNGCVNGELLRQCIKNDTGLVSVMMANNETGVIQNTVELASICRDDGIFFHTDASQAAGKVAVDFAGSGYHALTLSAHKLYGPLGAGALVVDKKLPLRAVLTGGSQEHGLRAGTENVAAIVGFGKAAEIAVQSLSQRQQHARQLRDSLEQALHRIPEVTIFAEHSERLPNTVQFAVSGFEGESLLMQLDRKAIAVSSGSACTSGKTEPSHVLQAMNVPTDLALAAIRVSFGENNTGADVDTLIDALQNIIETSNRSSVMMAAGL